MGKFIGGAVLVLAILLVIWGILPFGTVGAGERGVVLKWGAVTGEVYDEGLYWRTPFAEKVVTMDVSVQKEEVTASAASKDLQTVSSKVAVNYHLDSGKVSRIYQEFRKDYGTRLIAPALQESVKAAAAKYTAEELITKRAVVSEEMQGNLKEKLTDKGIVVDLFNILDFDFSPQFNAAIEGKVTAEQNAKKAQNQLVQVQAEAQQQIEKAKAEAETIRLQSAAANNDKYVQLKQLEVQLEFAKKWNGVLPQNLYGQAPIPFLQIGK